MASGLCAAVLENPLAIGYLASMTDLATKIRQLRISLGLNQTEFAARFPVTQASVSRWEKGSMPDPSSLSKLAEMMDLDVRQLIGADFTISTGTRPRLLVRGAVKAGAWNEAVEWPEEKWTPYTGGEHVSAPLDRRFGLVVEGESMNRVYPPGTILDCVSTIGTGEYPRHSQHVIVVRQRIDGDFEATVKEYRKEGSQEWLVPNSTNPAFQAPIQVGTEEDGIVETTIMAIVRGSYRPE